MPQDTGMALKRVAGNTLSKQYPQAKKQKQTLQTRRSSSSSGKAQKSRQKQPANPTPITGGRNDLPENVTSQKVAEKSIDRGMENATLEAEKIFNDPIHGNIAIHPLCVKIIDTPQFQRLRSIKQLGAVQYVYPGATHTRFEHSIGTSYLAGKWVRKLMRTLSEDSAKHIRVEDQLCVIIAALCHDMGHGPFSHMFDGYFRYIKKVASSKSSDQVYQHEDLSVRMFYYMIVANKLEESFAQYGLMDQEIAFIADLIQPSNDPESFDETKKWKHFLYEIVNNKSNGIDVDKWDYFARDCHQLNIVNCFDYKRLMRFSRVIKEQNSGITHVCFRDKEAENLYKMFELRYDLHRQAYKHRVSHVIHIMLADAFTSADGVLKTRGEMWHYCDHDHPAVKRSNDMYLCAEDHEATRTYQRERNDFSDCVEDMAIFSNLNDSIVHQIMQSGDPRLIKSQNIIDRIHKRDLYQTYRTLPKVGEAPNKHHVRNTILQMVAEMTENHHNKPDVVITCVHLDYSRQEHDPIDSVEFFAKSNPNEILVTSQRKKFRLPPADFSQHIVYLSCRDTNKTQFPVLLRCFRDWCNTNAYNVDE